MVTKKQQAHVAAYKAKAYWRPTVYLPKSTEAPIRAFCEERGLSINELMNAAVKAYINAEKGTR